MGTLKPDGPAVLGTWVDMVLRDEKTNRRMPAMKLMFKPCNSTEIAPILVPLTKSGVDFLAHLLRNTEGGVVLESDFVAHVLGIGKPVSLFEIQHMDTRDIQFLFDTYLRGKIVILTQKLKQDHDGKYWTITAAERPSPLDLLALSGTST